MAHQNHVLQVRPSRSAEQTARVAWTVLGLATLFCLALCGLVGYGLWRLRSSLVGPQAGNTLEAYESPVFRIYAGEVQPVEVPVQQAIPLREGETVRVGESAPPGPDALVTLWESSTLQLFAGTRVSLERLQATIYSDQSQDVVLELSAGQVLLGVTQIGRYEQAHFVVSLPGARAELAPGGTYLLRAGPVTEVAVRHGEARVSSSSAPSTVVLTTGQKAALQAGLLSVEPAHWQLLQNGDFSQQTDGRLKDWTFRPDNYGSSSSVNATYRVIEEAVDDHVAQVIELERKGSLVDRGAAILFQDTGVDISAYTSVRLDLDVNLKRQSPPGGGAFGVDYPFAVRISYQDADGRNRQYLYGFYYYTSEGNQTTLEDGEAKQILHSAWEHESLELLNMPVPPVLLTKIELLGSGQDYRSWVANVSLTANLTND
jgi:hypothetical protein